MGRTKSFKFGNNRSLPLVRKFGVKKVLVSSAPWSLLTPLPLGLNAKCRALSLGVFGLGLWVFWFLGERNPGPGFPFGETPKMAFLVPGLFVLEWEESRLKKPLRRVFLPFPENGMPRGRNRGIPEGAFRNPPQEEKEFGPKKSKWGKKNRKF